jgi:hypothetical protein
MTDQIPPAAGDSPYQTPDSVPAHFAHCPDCHAEVTTDAQTCWMCGRVLNVVDAEVVSPATPVATATFSLAPMMIVVTLVAVGLGLFVTAPGLGILYAIAMVPALVRTAVGVRKRAKDGKVLGIEDKFQLFATSVAVTVAACVAATVAFFATCLSTCFVFIAFEKNLHSSGEESLIFFAFAAAGLLALAAFGGVFYLCRTRRK